MKIKTLKLADSNFYQSLENAISFDEEDNSQIQQTVKDIVQAVKVNGDQALLEFTKKFDKVDLDNPSDLELPSSILKEAYDSLDTSTQNALNESAQRIKIYHEKQVQDSWSYKEEDGTVLGQKITALDSVGLYVPGGKASYPSSVLMNAIPAKVAGVKNLVMVVPTPNDERNALVLAAAYVANVDRVFTIGGAQAVAALAYGTNTIPQVDKIVGPGNAYVAEAKRVVFGTVGIDMIAGPSEVSIIADKFSNPEWIASDLLAQAEHDVFAQSILISNSKELINLVKIKLKFQLKNLPKKNIASKSIKNFGLAIYANSHNRILDVVNLIAPEHLEIDLKNYSNIIKKIRNAGSIFLGKYSPEAIGDYIAGPNHVLPTSGSAKFSSGLSVNDFLKRQSLIKITKTGIERLGPSVINLAQHENLEGHANSVKIRIKKG